MDIKWENRRNMDLAGLDNENKIKLLEERLFMFPNLTFNIIKNELNSNLKTLENEFDDEFLNGYKSVMNIIETFSNQYVGDEGIYNEYAHSTNGLSILNDIQSDEKRITELIKRLDKEPINTYYEIDRLLNAFLKKSNFNVSNGFREGYCRGCGTIAASWIEAKEEQNFNNEFIFKLNAKEPVRIYDLIKREQDIRIATMHCALDFEELNANFGF